MVRVGEAETSAASRESPASRARTRVYVDMWAGAGPPPERRAVTAGSPRAPLDGGPSWGRQSTCHRRPGEPMVDIASHPHAPQARLTAACRRTTGSVTDVRTTVFRHDRRR